MSSNVALANFALTILGEDRITSLDDNLKRARDVKALFDITRDSLIAGYNWSFAKTRIQLPALADPPAFEYALAFQLPADCLRIVFVGDYYAGLDLTNYRGAPVKEFTIEGRQILTNLSDPLNLQYIKRVTDSGQFSANFETAFACKLAYELAEPLSSSTSKKESALKEFDRAIALAVRAGAIEMPPEPLADDSWITSRL